MPRFRHISVLVAAVLVASLAAATAFANTPSSSADKRHAYLGVVLIGGTAASNGEARVRWVAPGSPAAKAGIHAGDIVRAYNGYPIRSAAALTRKVAASIPGDRVALTIQRGGEQRTGYVTLASRLPGSKAT